MPANPAAQTTMTHVSIQLPVPIDLSTQSTEAFLVKWDAGQRPKKKGDVSKSEFFFHIAHVICPELPSL